MSAATWGPVATGAGKPSRFAASISVWIVASSARLKCASVNWQANSGNSRPTADCCVRTDIQDLLAECKMKSDALDFDSGVDAFAFALRRALDEIEHMRATRAEHDVALGVGRLRLVDDEFALVLHVLVRDARRDAQRDTGLDRPDVVHFPADEQTADVVGPRQQPAWRAVADLRRRDSPTPRRVERIPGVVIRIDRALRVDHFLGHDPIHLT